jgi:hypothetical protein
VRALRPLNLVELTFALSVVNTPNDSLVPLRVSRIVACDWLQTLQCGLAPADLRRKLNMAASSALADELKRALAGTRITVKSPSDQGARTL